MTFGYTVLYVPDVEGTIAFYEQAFGLTRRFVAPTGEYGELETGATALGFAQEDFAESGRGRPAARLRPDGDPPGFNLTFITEDVAADYARAVEAGCVSILEPTEKPWGQTVSYLLDLNGVIVEIATAVSG